MSREDSAWVTHEKKNKIQMRQIFFFFWFTQRTLSSNKTPEVSLLTVWWKTLENYMIQQKLGHPETVAGQYSVANLFVQVQ